VDIDLHHGNGIQKAFYDTDEVLYVSMHHFPCYPGTGNFGEVGAGRGEGFTVNIPLGKGQGDEEFARIVFFLVNPLAQSYRPEMILVSCGFDLYVKDRLAAMRVTPEGYALITSFLLAIAEEVCQGKIAFIMEGGYSLRGIRECGLRVLQELCGVSTSDLRRIDKIIASSPQKSSTIRKVMEVQAKYWPVFNRQ
jgi:acetoin utilization deacetylase AcuC-like enzyme